MNDSERKLLKAWLAAVGADGQDIYCQAREHKKFLQVLREVKAEAWTDGYLSAHWDMQDDTETPNPYEEEGTVSTWSERAHRAAEALDMEAIEATDPEDVQYGFREGARWQREALLSDDAIERAAREMYWQANEWEDGQIVWETPEQIAEEIEEWVPLARAALTAAIGDDTETPNPYEED